MHWRSEVAATFRAAGFVSIAMLILVSLPPFLHWAMTKPVIVPATTESSR